MQAYVSQTRSDITAVGTLDRPAFIFNFRNCTSPSPLSGPSETPKQSPTTRQEGLQSSTKNRPEIADGPSLVDSQSKKDQWMPNSTTSSKSSNHVRCLVNRCNLSEHEYRGILDNTRENFPHKHTRTEGSLPSPPDLCSTVQQLPHPVVDRQHNGNSLHQPQTRHAFLRHCQT